MNTFTFKKELYSNKAITKEQLKAVHADLVGLGYRKSYQEFYFDLAEYCENFLEEDKGLLSKEAKPHLSNYLLQLLETLTQPHLDSRIFALCGLEKRSQTSARVPGLSVRRQEALEIIFAVHPELEELLRNAIYQDFLIGFAAPVYRESDYPNTTLYPREEILSDIRIGRKERKVLDRDGKVSLVSEPAKISFTVTAGTNQYEFPLYWNGQDVGMIKTECFPIEKPILAIKSKIFPIEDYEPIAKKYNGFRIEQDQYPMEFKRTP